MLKQTSNKYFIVGNVNYSLQEILEIFTTDNEITKNDIKVVIPDSFKSYTGRKYIKVYGCTLHNHYIEYDVTNQKLLNDVISVPSHTNLHSNLANMNNTQAIASQKIDKDGNINYVHEYMDYVVTTNNFLNQKIYEVPDTMTEIDFYFTDHYGFKVPIFNKMDISGSSSNTKVFVLNLSLYKIEMEMIKG
jgi:hypothetical protein